MDGIAVDAQRLAAAGTGVGDVGTQLTTEIATMGELLAELRAGWQSEQAAPKFAVAMQGYLDDATLLKNALLSHGETLLASGRAYAEVESAVAAAVPRWAAMTTISANYGAMAAGHDGLVATWQRIEGHLSQLDGTVASTRDMKAEALVAYEALKARWSAAAQDRQITLQALGGLVDEARQHYQRVDAALAAGFGG